MSTSASLRLSLTQIILAVRAVSTANSGPSIANTHGHIVNKASVTTEIVAAVVELPPQRAVANPRYNHLANVDRMGAKLALKLGVNGDNYILIDAT
ncbi:hypothetical protein L2E82_02427 [Cichorium intybus]|uniref:Uncharacterized protein n=1 Tax=Cichorium intybus TaxID=13427 RepID=A0ACB9H3S3_CICIN|nr:hypothetical protein L2E82_02427 [Cichorium intybus]